jgi:sulfate permease, SulP family
MIIQSQTHEPAATVTEGPSKAPSGPSPVPHWLFRRIPALDALRTYTWSTLGRDAAAGLTVATIAVPQAMAYAALAGLPPEYGLYTAIVMTAVGALLDSSRLLINGPTNAISIALLSALAVVPANERVSAAILLALMVGVIQLSLALVRLGNLIRHVSHPVIVGFTLGAATLLVLDQTRHLLGLAEPGDANHHFIVRFWRSLVGGGGVHLPTLAIGAGTIAVVLLVRRLNAARRTRFPLPQHLVAVVFMGIVVWALSLDAAGVKIVDHVPAGLPVFQAPELRLDHGRLLAGSAVAIALLGLLEAVAMARAIAVRTGQPLDVNQQCLSEGAANLAGSFFQCFPGSGSLTRSAVNQQAGAVSQWSGVFAAAAVALTVVFAAPLAYYIPRASLAGLLVLAAYRMVDLRQVVHQLRSSKLDAVVLIATAASAVFVSIEFCILIGVVVSAAGAIIRKLRRTASV